MIRYATCGGIFLGKRRKHLRYKNSRRHVDGNKLVQGIYLYISLRHLSDLYSYVIVQSQELKIQLTHVKTCVADQK